MNPDLTRLAALVERHGWEYGRAALTIPPDHWSAGQRLAVETFLTIHAQEAIPAPISTPVGSSPASAIKRPEKDRESTANSRRIPLDRTGRSQESKYLDGLARICHEAPTFPTVPYSELTEGQKNVMREYCRALVQWAKSGDWI